MELGRAQRVLFQEENAPRNPASACTGGLHVLRPPGGRGDRTRVRRNARVCQEELEVLVTSRSECIREHEQSLIFNGERDSGLVKLQDDAGTLVPGGLPYSDECPALSGTSKLVLDRQEQRARPLPLSEVSTLPAQSSLMAVFHVPGSVSEQDQTESGNQGLTDERRNPPPARVEPVGCPAQKYADENSHVDRAAYGDPEDEVVSEPASHLRD